MATVVFPLSALVIIRSGWSERNFLESRDIFKRRHSVVEEGEDDDRNLSRKLTERFLISEENTGSNLERLDSIFLMNSKAVCCKFLWGGRLNLSPNWSRH